MRLSSSRRRRCSGVRQPLLDAAGSPILGGPAFARREAQRNATHGRQEDRVAPARLRQYLRIRGLSWMCTDYDLQKSAAMLEFSLSAVVEHVDFKSMQQHDIPVRKQ